MGIRSLTGKLAFGVLFFAMLSAPAAAGLDVDFGAAVRLDDDTQVYFAVSSRYFDRDRREVEAWARRYDHPDDLAVALYIGRHSGRSLDSIWRLRDEGRSWWEIGVRFGMPADVWFVPVRRDPGPPYGKAYGHWKKHRHDRNAALSLTDADIRNLTAVRVLHEYYGVSVEVAMDWRSGGRDLRSLVSEEYRGRHGTTGTPPGRAKGGTGNDHADHKDAKGKARGKGAGKGKP
jgi:hypothetical protein